MWEYRKEITTAVSITVIGVLVLAGAANYIASFQSAEPNGTSSLVISSSHTATSSVASRTAACGSPGVYCGDFNITSASLTVNGSSSVLQVTIDDDIGNMYIGSATAYINGTVIGVPPASQYEPPGNILLNVQPGQQAVLILTIPYTTIPIQVGRTYSVMVYGWMGSPGGRASMGGPHYVNVTAN